MLKSMTAFARVEENHTMGQFVWEIRSINHRYLEMNFRLPEDVRAAEFAMRKQLQDSLSRGKVDCSFKLRTTLDTQVEVTLNDKLVDSLLQQVQVLQNKTSAQEDNGLRVGAVNPLELLNWPGVAEQSQVDQSAMIEIVKVSFQQAVEALIKNRQIEGARLRELIIKRLDELTRLVKDVRVRRPQVLQAVREKIMSRIEEMSIDVESTRIEQELVFLAQKLDVEEELDRLDSHLAELNDVVNSQKPVGRRMDFLMQELNREANTLSSKSADISTTQASVAMKVCIEQMREQIQNIE